MDLRSFLSKITLAEYINHFGSYWDQEHFEVKPLKLWPMQAAYCDWLEKNPYALVPKARQLGMSEVMAERIVRDLLRFPQCEGVVISKTDPDAQYFLKKRVLPKLQNLPVIEGLDWPAIKKSTKDSIELENGSIVSSLPASSGSAASRTGNFLAFDECGLIDKQPNASFEEMLNNALPTIEKAGDRGWMMGVGTSEPGSYYNEMMRKVVAGKMSRYKYFFLPWSADPTRTQQWKKETLETMTDETEFRLKFPETIEDFFAVKEGLVLPNFDPKSGGKHVNYFTPNYKLKLICGYDHGYRHPAVFLVALYDPYKDHLYIVSEKYWYETPVEDIAPQVNDTIRRTGKIPWRLVADTAIFAQTGVRSVAEHFKTLGVRFNKSDKYKGLTGEAGSLSLLSERFTKGTITISPECVNLIEQLSSWKWNDKRKGEVPEDINDDGPDVLRYLVAELRQQFRGEVHSPPQPYSPEAREAKRRLNRRPQPSHPGDSKDSEGLFSWMSM